MSNKEEKPKKKLPEMKDTAFSVVQQDGVWQLVKIKFDIDSGQLGDVSLTPMDDLPYAITRAEVEIRNEVNQKRNGNV